MAKKQRKIIIANPMYDIVFKTLMMTNKEFARYFVETIIGVKITEIDFAPQEYTYERKKETNNQVVIIKVIRLDFVATIRTKDGNLKRVLIEIQQSHKPIDVLRFCTYLGKQYIQSALEATEEEGEGEEDEEKEDKDVKALPIISIYMLGYNMPTNPHIAVKVDRVGKNLLGGERVELNDPLMETLTHEAYFIQVARIKEVMYENWETCSELLKLLSLFEQSNFIEEKHYKKYKYPKTNNKTLEKMIRTLERIAADAYIKRIMEEQDFDELEVNLLQKTIESLQSNNTALQSNNLALQSNNTALQIQLAEYQRRFGNLNFATI